MRKGPEAPKTRHPTTAGTICLGYTPVRRAGRDPPRLRLQDDTVRHRQTMMNGAVGHGSGGNLSADDPPEADVPRGSHLNVRV